jgi:hypothetical protein
MQSTAELVAITSSLDRSRFQADLGYFLPMRHVSGLAGEAAASIGRDSRLDKAFFGATFGLQLRAFSHHPFDSPIAYNTLFRLRGGILASAGSRVDPGVMEGYAMLAIAERMWLQFGEGYHLGFLDIGPFVRVTGVMSVSGDQPPTEEMPDVERVPSPVPQRELVFGVTTTVGWGFIAGVAGGGVH